MGWLKDQSVRLLRDDWKTAKLLAQELFAMFQAEPAATNPTGQAQLTPGPTGQAPLQLGDIGSQPFLTLRNPNGDVIGSISLAGGAYVFSPALTGAGAGSGSGGGGIPAQIVSGTGATYTVTAFPNGLAGGSLTVTATQLQIDPSETIPAGSWTHIFKGTDGSYTMQFPVWMSD